MGLRQGVLFLEEPPESGFWGYVERYWSVCVSMVARFSVLSRDRSV